MAKLVCCDFGFECEFETDESSDEESILDQFAEHMREEHGIEYTKDEIRHLPVSDDLPREKIKS